MALLLTDRDRIIIQNQQYLSKSKILDYIHSEGHTIYLL